MRTGYEIREGSCELARRAAAYEPVTLYTYAHPGMDGGTWYAAEYPLGATRYYRTEAARTKAIAAYTRAIEDTGGHVLTIAA